MENEAQRRILKLSVLTFCMIRTAVSYAGMDETLGSEESEESEEESEESEQSEESEESAYED